MSESINQHGILQPLIVYVNGDRYMAVDGHYRLAAEWPAGTQGSSATVVVSRQNRTPICCWSTQLAANNMRLDLKPTEKAMGYQRLKELRGLSNVELARLLNVSKSVVTETLSYSSSACLPICRRHSIKARSGAKHSICD